MTIALRLFPVAHVSCELRPVFALYRPVKSIDVLASLQSRAAFIPRAAVPLLVFVQKQLWHGQAKQLRDVVKVARVNRELLFTFHTAMKSWLVPRSPNLFQPASGFRFVPALLHHQRTHAGAKFLARLTTAHNTCPICRNESQVGLL